MARNKYPDETVKLIISVARNLFLEKGYDNTSIQDIINGLGGLSKGAVYHHFKSKEEIFEAVCRKIGEENSDYYAKMRDNKEQNAMEKLETMVRAGYMNPNNNILRCISGRVLEDPKFMVNQIHEIFEVVVPLYIQPVIEEGMRDGTIKTEYPKELSEVVLVLINVWINPLLSRGSVRQMRQKLEFMDQLLRGIGIFLLKDDMIDEYVKYGESLSYFEK